MEDENVSKKFPGEWLLLYKDEIIDHSSNVEEVLRLAEEKFPEEKYSSDKVKISKVLSEDIHLR
ncbi:MAG: DUF5678 domain-containing protein [Candidatus Thermoplasmatota archaeon]